LFVSTITVVNKRFPVIESSLPSNSLKAARVKASRQGQPPCCFLWSAEASKFSRRRQRHCGRARHTRGVVVGLSFWCPQIGRKCRKRKRSAWKMLLYANPCINLTFHFVCWSFHKWHCLQLLILLTVF